MNYLLEGQGPLRDIIDSLSNYMTVTKKASDKKDVNADKYLKGSISNYTKDLIMTFPTMCDSSLPASTASMISKANERNIVAMLEMLFASIQFNGSNGADILATVHKNISSNIAMDDYIDALGDLYEKSKDGKLFENSADLERAAKKLTQLLKEQNFSFPVNSLNETSVNDFVVNNGANGQIVVTEKLSSDKKHQYKYDKKRYDSTTSDVGGKGDQFTKNTFAKDDAEIKISDELRKQRKEERDIESDKIKNDKANSDILRNQIQNSADQVASLGRMLIDQDVKKCNELTPTLMVVRYNEQNPDGTIYDSKAFVAGVKSRLIPVDATDIIERLISKNKTKVSFLNFIRATTGEIGFVKDFLLGIKQAKIDAKNAAKRGYAARMWRVLENRSIKNNWNKINKKGNDASSITVLVVNQETVNLMRKEYDFDLEQVKNAKLIMDSYNLLGIVICDESLEVAKFLYAGNDSFEHQAYSFLEREENGNSYKKVINLISKMNNR